MRSPPTTHHRAVSGSLFAIVRQIYPLGVVLYEFSAQCALYALARESRGALEEAILHDDPVRPSEAAPSRGAQGAAGDLDRWMKALSKNPEERMTR